MGAPAGGEDPAGFPSPDGALEFGWDKPVSQRKRKEESKRKAKPGSFGAFCHPAGKWPFMHAHTGGDDHAYHSLCHARMEKHPSGPPPPRASHHPRRHPSTPGTHTLSPLMEAR